MIETNFYIALMIAILFCVVETQCRITMEKSPFKPPFYDSCLYTAYDLLSIVVILISTVIICLATSWWFMLKMVGWFIISPLIGITGVKLIINILFGDKAIIYGRFLSIIITLLSSIVCIYYWFS